MKSLKDSKRRESKNILKAISLETRECKSLKISQNLKELLSYLHKNYFHDLRKLFIGGYCPIQQEVSWHKELKEVEHEFCFPQIEENGSMKYIQSSITEMIDMNWGITHPHVHKEEVRPKVIVVPGLSFSTDCNRLGRGGGYFDRYLQNFEGIKIGVAFKEQIVEKLDCEEHDELMDFIITEDCIYRRKLGE